MNFDQRWTEFLVNISRFLVTNNFVSRKKSFYLKGEYDLLLAEKDYETIVPKKIDI